jgi:ATP-dependent Clp protease ATP-binding subunit ClpA
MGARPLAAVIQEHIKKPLANEMLFGKLRKGGVVHVTVGKQEDGTVPVKPKPEAEVEEASEEAGAKAKKSRPAKKSKGRDDGEPARPMAEADVTASEEAPQTPPRKGSIVPRVPKSK